MSFSGRFAQRFRRLQWKLAFFYILTTLLVLFALELAGALLLLFGLTMFPLNGFAFQVGIVAQNVGANFLGPFANRAALDGALRDWRQNSGISFEGYVVVVDSAGRVLAAAGDQPPVPDTSLSSQLPESVQQLLREAFVHDPSTVTKQTTAISENNGTDYIVAPVVSERRIRGALLVKARQVQIFSPALWKAFPTFLLYAGGSLLIFFIGAGVVGVAFGVATARSLVHRIRRILASVEQWSRGEFSTFVEDASSDELGQLAQRLNLMAHQLHDLLYTRQALAALQERNRLARELHDSVKQEVFALSIWLRNARALIGRDEEAAKQQLSEAERVIRQTQLELTSLIRELRPVALSGKVLARALQDYVQTWREQTGIRAILEVHGEQEVVAAIEEAFFRIAQEALANVARHSQASLVTLRLDVGPGVRLSISDDGCGFDVERAGATGVGLASMRERVEELHGQIEIQSQPGQGTTITVRCAQQPEGEPCETMTGDERQ
jgi:signal transduction histidine kinase